MNQYPIIKSQSGLERNPALEKPGRLNYEYGTNPKQVLATVADAIHRAGAVMGISVEPEKAVLSSREAIKKILESFPLAWVEDICRAINMASFGEIRLENQLSVLSAANIYGWYKEFRTNHPDKHCAPMLPPKPIQEEISNEKKYELSVAGFEKILQNPKIDEFGSIIFYDRFEKLGVINKQPAEKTNLVMGMIDKKMANLPYEFKMEKDKRKDVAEWRNRNPEERIDWVEWSGNQFVKHCINEVKRQLVSEAVGKADKKELLDKYKKMLADELSITI